MRYDSVEIIVDPERIKHIEQTEGKHIIPAREAYTDKAEMKRGGNNYDEVPVEAKVRIVAVGFHDPDVLEGKVETSSPTLPREGLAMVLQSAACFGWQLACGDVENGFLQGAYWNRTLYLRVPKQGFPEVTLDSGEVIPAVPGGSLLRTKKAVYGTADAPR